MNDTARLSQPVAPWLLNLDSPTGARLGPLFYPAGAGDLFLASPPIAFYALSRYRNILAQVSTLAVVSTGITFVLLCGEIDLSIAAVATMTGVVAAALFGEGLHFSEALYIGGGWAFAGGILGDRRRGLCHGLRAAQRLEHHPDRPALLYGNLRRRCRLQPGLGRIFYQRRNCLYAGSTAFLPGW